MTDETTLSMLRDAEPDQEPTQEALVLQRLDLLLNVLDDLKLKQSITNELLLELVEQGKVMARSDFGAQVRPIRDKPFPRPIRRSSENHQSGGSCRRRFESPRLLRNDE